MNKIDQAKEHFEAAIHIMPNHLEVGPDEPSLRNSGVLNLQV